MPRSKNLRNFTINDVVPFVRQVPGMPLVTLAFRMGASSSPTKLRSEAKERLLEIIAEHPDQVRMACDRFGLGARPRQQLMETDPQSEQYKNLIDHAIRTTPIKVYPAGHPHSTRELPVPCAKGTAPMFATRQQTTPVITTKEVTPMVNRTTQQIHDEVRQLVSEYVGRNERFTLTGITKKVGINSNFWGKNAGLRQFVEDAIAGLEAATDTQGPIDEEDEEKEPNQELTPTPSMEILHLRSEVERLNELVQLLHQKNAELEALQQQHMPPAKLSQLSDRELLVQALRRSEAQLIVKIQSLEAEQQKLEEQVKQAIASLHGVQVALRCEGETVEPEFRMIHAPSLNGSSGLAIHH